MSDAAISMFITSLTDAFSFGVGTITSIPAVQLFCIYTATAVILTFVYQVSGAFSPPRNTPISPLDHVLRRLSLASHLLGGVRVALRLSTAGHCAREDRDVHVVSKAVLARLAAAQKRRKYGSEYSRHRRGAFLPKLASFCLCFFLAASMRAHI